MDFHSIDQNEFRSFPLQVLDRRDENLQLIGILVFVVVRSYLSKIGGSRSLTLRLADEIVKITRIPNICRYPE